MQDFQRKFLMLGRSRNCFFFIMCLLKDDTMVNIVYSFELFKCNDNIKMPMLLNQAGLHYFASKLKPDCNISC